MLIFRVNAKKNANKIGQEDWPGKSQEPFLLADGS
jgi:hypothetical protein